MREGIFPSVKEKPFRKDDFWGRIKKRMLVASLFHGSVVSLHGTISSQK
jgi:hypothetical protein